MKLEKDSVLRFLVGASIFYLPFLILDLVITKSFRFIPFLIYWNVAMIFYFLLMKIEDSLVAR